MRLNRGDPRDPGKNDPGNGEATVLPPVDGARTVPSVASWLDGVARVGYRGVYLLARTWWWLRRPSTSGALVAFWRGDQILLVRTSYRRIYSLPGGFVERQETAAAAATREILKEIGVTASPDDLITAWRGTLPFESRTDTVTIFECSADVSARHIDGREIVWAGWVSVNGARKLPLLPHVRAYLTSRSPDRTARV
jgi:8-oxo-dGTP diphosphatase